MDEKVRYTYSAYLPAFPVLPTGEGIRNFQLKFSVSPETTDEHHVNSVHSTSPTMDFAGVVDAWFSEMDKFVHDDVQRYVSVK
jgi:hypothetical protein